MMKKIILFLFACAMLTTLNAQEKKDEEKKFGISFSGFVKSDFFFDSRQTVAAREGHFLLWPAAKSLDQNEDDINAKSNLNFLAVQSRISGKISGPDAFGAKTSGVIEGDFFAQANDNINLFRLRHAFVKLNWTNTEMLAGQYWNPLFVTGCFPGTVSFNTGTPLQSFARNPQLRITQSFGKIKVIGAFLSQRDYTSRAAGVSSEYLRNAVTPDLHFQVHYEDKNAETKTGFLVGAGIAYKTIIPRLSNTITVTPAVTAIDTVTMTVTTTTTAVTETYKVDEKVSGLTAIGFTKITLKPVTIKLQGRYGENIADVLSISGFAVKNVANATIGELSYTPLKNSTFWGEIHTNGGNVQLGVFAGYLKNLGTKEEMSDAGNTVYGLATGIESLLRVSPRIVVKSNKVKFAAEVEYTEAAYGNAGTYDVNYVPASTTKVSNTRLLLSAIYAF